MRETNIQNFIIEEKLNLEVPNQYKLKYGNLNEYVNSFIDHIGDKRYIKSEYLDLVKHVPYEKTSISFITANDASVAGRRYQEAYFCQTPLCYAYEDLLRLFNEKMPKTRIRNAVKTYLEPLVPELCAKYLILCALIESCVVNGNKSIIMSITSKSLKVSYSYNPSFVNKEVLKTKKEYFEVFGIDFDHIEDDFDKFFQEHRTKIRNAYYKGIKTLEILYNVRSSTFKMYSIASDQVGLLSKAEYDIYNFIKNRNGATLKLLANEFGYNSSRAVKYHTDKLIKSGMIQRVGISKSHNCFYRVK